MSKLVEYISILEDIENGIHPLVKLINKNAGNELPIKAKTLHLLHDAGLIELEDNIASSKSKVYITPKGALALFEWKRAIEERSIKGKVMNNLNRFFWLLTGVLLTTVANLIS